MPNGVHVPHRTVGFGVGGLESGPEVGVTLYRMVFDDVVQRLLKESSCKADGRVVLIFTVLERQKYNYLTFDLTKR